MNHIPNVLSLFRLLVGIPLLYAASADAWGLCLILIGAGYVSDLIDGPLARRFNAVSKYGKTYDLTADVIFDWTIVGGLVLTHRLEWWLAAGIATTILFIRLPSFIPTLYKLGTIALPIWFGGMAWSVYLYVEPTGYEVLLLQAAVPVLLLVVWFKRERIWSDVQMALKSFFLK